MTNEIPRLTGEVSQLLTEKRIQLVLAESCTGGLVAASLATIPGISNHFCGSAVTYQNDTKQAWLKIPTEILENPGPVSQQTTLLMAENVLERTPQANLAAAVTGHLGPAAPPKLDGKIYLAAAWRDPKSDRVLTKVVRRQLQSATRKSRQREAAALTLKLIRDVAKRVRP